MENDNQSTQSVSTEVVQNDNGLESNVQMATTETSKEVVVVESPNLDVTDKCPICLSEIVNKSSTNKCNHKFCFNCLVEWSEQRFQCPVCRQDFTEIRHSFQSEFEFITIGGHVLDVFHSSKKFVISLKLDIEVLTEQLVANESTIEILRTKLAIKNSGLTFAEVVYNKMFDILSNGEQVGDNVKGLLNLLKLLKFLSTVEL